MAEDKGEPRFKVLFNAKTASHDEAIRHAFESGHPPYTITRGLRTKIMGDEAISGYNECLPKYKGLTLEEWIKAMHTNGISIVHLADIGYGAGNLLLDVTREYEFVKALGFGREAYAKFGAPDKGMYPTYDDLTKNPRANLVEGDLPFTEEQIASSSQDIVVLNNVLLYVPDLEGRVLVDICRVLSSNGISLLNQLNLAEDEIRRLLVSQNIRPENIEIGNSNDPNIRRTLAFQK